MISDGGKCSESLIVGYEYALLSLFSDTEMRRNTLLAHISRKYAPCASMWAACKRLTDSVRRARSVRCPSPYANAVGLVPAFQGPQRDSLF